MNVRGNVRTCGGHIHLGGDFQCPDFVAALFAELFLGVFGRLPMNFKSVRQRWYGQPGIFRSKPYGIEYRTPDSSWTSDTSYMEYIELRRYMSGERRDSGTRNFLIESAKAAGIEV